MLAAFSTGKDILDPRKEVEELCVFEGVFGIVAAKVVGNVKEKIPKNRTPNPCRKLYKHF
jgi:hypothetical protein